METLMIAARTTVFTLVLTGIAYPLAITGAAQVLFPGRANGSLVSDARGHVVGSELLAQGFSRPGYFHPRVSAAGDGYDPLASGGSNLGPTSQKLHDRIAADVARLQKENPDAVGPVPAELVTSSGSGLDPHLSLESARWQLPRVAKAREVAPDRIARVLDDQLEGRELGVLGEPRVNVLLLNLELDRQFGRVR